MALYTNVRLSTLVQIKLLCDGLNIYGAQRMIIKTRRSLDSSSTSRSKFVVCYLLKYLQDRLL